MKLDQEYITTMSRERRIRSQALAILRRAKTAGIPDDFMRIKPDVFRKLLHDDFYIQRNMSPDKITDAIYNAAENLFTKRFFIIDGGDVAGFSRKKAGFALLFRMIACDRLGVHEQGKQLVHFLNTAFVTNDMPRHKYIENIKDYDVLFISELSLSDFKANLEGGSYMDDLLEYRHSNELPTIISLVKPVFSIEGGNDGAADGTCGRFLYQLVHSDVENLKERMQEDFKIARIRVK